MLMSLQIRQFRTNFLVSHMKKIEEVIGVQP